MNHILNFIDFLFYAFYLAILARVILSWLRFDPYHPVSTFLHQMTEPILAPIRRLLPPTGMIDFSPLVALLLLQVVQIVIREIIFYLY